MLGITWLWMEQKKWQVYWICQATDKTNQNQMDNIKNSFNKKLWNGSAYRSPEYKGEKADFKLYGIKYLGEDKNYILFQVLPGK